MATATNKANVNLNAYAWLTFDECSGRRTNRSARPSEPGLEAWSATSGPTMEVDFVGRGTLEGHMRTMLVIPSDKPIEFALKQTAPEWHHIQHLRAALFQCQDKALANGNASSLPDGTSAMTYVLSAAPRSKVGRGELGTRVRHEVFGRGSQLGDELAEELTDL